jgi:hypothetical protein
MQMKVYFHSLEIRLKYVHLLQEWVV